MLQPTHRSPRLATAPRLGLQLLAIWIAAAVVRFAALRCDRESLLFEVGGVDADQYLNMARGFWTHAWPGASPFFFAPGYPLFLSMLSAVSDSHTWFLSVQIVLGASSCAMAGLLAYDLFENLKIVWLTGAIAALYGPLVAYDLQISPATLDVFLELSVLVLLMRVERQPRTRLWLVAAGVAVGVSAITRGAVLLFLPVALAWIWTVRPRGAAAESTRWQRRLGAGARCLTFVTPILLLVAPVAWHNYQTDLLPSESGNAVEGDARASGRFSLISYNAGINLLLGNDPRYKEATEVEDPLCFVQYESAIQEPTRRGIRSAAAQSGYLTHLAFTAIVSNPSQWLRLALRKMGAALHGEERSREFSIYASAAENPILALLLWKHTIAFPSGIVIPLGLAGVVVASARSRAHRLLYSRLVLLLAFLLAFFVVTRYRLVFVAALFPYAAYALAALIELRRASLLRRGTLLASLSTFTVFCNWGVHPSDSRHQPFEYNHLGQVMLNEGRAEAAAALYWKALALDANYAPAHFNLAGHYAEMRQFARAEAHYKLGLRAAPMAYTARDEYAHLLRRQGRLQEALLQLRLVAARMPGKDVLRRLCELTLMAEPSTSDHRCDRTDMEHAAVY